MKDKHLDIRIRQCLILAEASGCPRRRFGAVLVDPERNVVLADGYNGGPRGQEGSLCRGTWCERDGVKSGTMMELGCHHAESNVIANAAANGVPTHGSWMIVTGEPCPMCAKLMHHAGVVCVVVVRGGYAGGSAGVEYLERVGVQVVYRDGPRDPRSSGIYEMT